MDVAFLMLAVVCFAAVIGLAYGCCALNRRQP